MKRLDINSAAEDKFKAALKLHEGAQHEMCINLWATESNVSIIIEDDNSPIRYSNQTNGEACNHCGYRLFS